MIVKCKILMKEPRTAIVKEYNKIFHVKSLETKFQEIEEKIIAEPETYPGIIMGITIEEITMKIPMNLVKEDSKLVPPPMPELSGPRN